MEEQGGEHEREESGNKSFIKIPSYEEVMLESSHPNPPPSLFRPSPSFSEAFSFIKSSEFYVPPQPSPPLPQQASGQPEAPPSSSSASASTSTSTSSSTLQSPYASPQSRSAILVSHRQKGNPLLKHIRNVKWMFADVVGDYLLGQSSCALYLSLRYHLLHPDYLYFRIRELQKNFKLRVVLCHVDVEDVVKPLLEVTRTALLHDCSLLCGWSLEECGRYLETIKVYENKSADSIRERMDTDYMSRLNYALTSVRHVNKNDAITLGSAFGSLSRIMDASMEDLARCPGIGDRKVKRLYDTFHEPFKRVSSRPAAMPEISVQKKVDETSESGKEESDASQVVKESSTTVKAALAAAFAKYSDKVHKRDGNHSDGKKDVKATSTASSDEKTDELPTI